MFCIRKNGALFVCGMVLVAFKIVVRFVCFGVHFGKQAALLYVLLWLKAEV